MVYNILPLLFIADQESYHQKALFAKLVGEQQKKFTIWVTHNEKKKERKKVSELMISKSHTM